MTLHAPRATITPHHAARAAAAAWAQLHGEAPATVRLWRKSSRTKPAIYRLTMRDGGRVFAKRFTGPGPTVERIVYETMLPRLPLSAPRYWGWCEDALGWSWMFVEDVGNRLVGRDPGHATLAARWLATLHRAGSGLSAGGLTDAGASRYRAHLCAGREAIHRNLGNPGLSQDDRAVLARVVELQGCLERRWEALEQACALTPPTLVHGDFRRKNVRWGCRDGTQVLLPIDWEMAGWGSPAADLASAWTTGMTIRFDRDVYRSTVRGDWSLDEPALRRLANVGRAFQALAAIDWASASLVFESPRWLLKPVTSMRRYSLQIAEAIEAGREWLA